MAERPRLRVPLAELFEDRLPERHVQRLWHGIDSARRTRRTVPTSLAIAFAWVSACAAVVVLVWFRPNGREPEALHLLGGKEVPSTLSAGADARTSFEDTSEVQVAPRTELDVLSNDGGRFALALRRGAAEFEVHPGGPRTWKIECGGVTVEVVGTHFTLARDTASLHVAVTRGAVLVRGERVPDGVVRLGAGQALTVPFDVPPAASSAHAAPVPSGTVKGPTEEVPSAPSATPEAPHAAAPRALVAMPAPPAPPEPEVAPSAEPPPAESVDALLDQADAARRSGNFPKAAELLERSIRTSPSAPHVSLAEFSLGRLYLDSLGDPARAAAHFSRATTGGLPGALAEDADARLVEAYARAGDGVRANAAASRYRARYPAGRRSADVDRWAASVH